MFTKSFKAKLWAFAKSINTLAILPMATFATLASFWKNDSKEIGDSIINSLGDMNWDLIQVGLFLLMIFFLAYRLFLANEKHKELSLQMDKETKRLDTQMDEETKRLTLQFLDVNTRFIKHKINSISIFQEADFKREYPEVKGKMLQAEVLKEGITEEGNPIIYLYTYEDLETPYFKVVVPLV